MNSIEATQAKYRREAAVRAKKDQIELEKFVPTLPQWQGWTGEWVDEDGVCFNSGEVVPRNYVLRCEADHFKMIFRPGGDGTCSFEVQGKGWLTFDRRGVESSFYWKPWDYRNAPPVIIEEVIRDLVNRVAQRRAYYTTAISIPQIGHTVSPEGKAALINDIKKIGFRNFMPSGFGTGYTISTKHVRFSNRAQPALEEFIGISPLYVSTFDAD